MVALVGAVIFSHCLGTLSSLISQVAGVEDRVQAKLRSVQEYLQFRGIPTEVRRKVKAHYQHCWRRSAVPYDEQTILSELSGGLRSQVMRSIGATAVLELPIFAGFEAECVGFLASRLRKMVFTEGEVIYREGSDAAEMLIIVEGRVELQAERGRGHAGRRSCQRMSAAEAAMLDDPASGLGAVQEVGDGDTLGELALFPDLYGRTRLETAVARTWGRAYTLAAEDLPEIKAQYPDVVAKLGELCELKFLQLRVLDDRFGSGRPGPEGTGQPCRIQMRSERLKADLLHRREAELLVPATGEVCMDILPLMRRAPAIASSSFTGSNRILVGSNRSLMGGRGSGAGMGVELQNLSCVFSGAGELLCVEHNLAGIAVDRPMSLGYLRVDRSRFRALGREELARLGDGHGRRQLFGCSVLLFKAGPVGVGEATEEAPAKLGLLKQPLSVSGEAKEVEAGHTVELFTWSPEVRR
jgi:CRP-like cAMP-binding protein